MKRLPSDKNWLSKLGAEKIRKRLNFPEMHIHIMNIKGWLRGIRHHCTKEQLQGYLDEYHFRYNRRNNMDTIFDMLIRNGALKVYKVISQTDNKCNLNVYIPNSIKMLPLHEND